MTFNRRLAALAAVLTVLTGLLVAPPANAAPARIRVVSFNICGNVCRGGEVQATAGNVAYQISSRRAAVVLLQEVCFSQFLAVRDKLRSKGYRAVFASAAQAGRCDNDDRENGKGFGNAILVRGEVSGRIARALPRPAAIRSEGRVLLGVTAKVNGRTLQVFTTHTAPSGPNLAAQLRTIRNIVEPIARRRPVLIGGDLNSLPDSPGLDTYYSSRVPSGNGVFREMDETTRDSSCRCGDPTFRPVPRKIDYVFASQRHFRPQGATTPDTRWSDHRLYVGEFILA